MKTTTSVAIGTDIFERMTKDASEAKTDDESDDDEDSVEEEVVVDDEAVAAQVELAIANLEKKKDLADEEPATKEKETPAEETPALEETPAEEAPVEEPATKEKETPAEETPALEEAPAEEAPVEEDPTTEIKSGLTPVEEDEGAAEGEEIHLVEETVEPGTEEATKEEVAEAAKEDEEAATPVKEEAPKEEVAPKVGEWAAFAQDIFLLTHFPPNWEASQLMEQCHVTDERVWKRYFDARCLLAKSCEDPKDEQKHEITPAQEYRQELEAAFNAEWRESVIGSMLGKHTYQRTAKVAKDRKTGKLEDATVVSTIFSPYFLPRAVQVCMRYHRKPKDFWCSWHVQFVTLTDHKDDKMAYWRPHLTDMWELCSNGYAEMPTEEIGFMAVEEIDIAYLTPNMVRKIRKWLFGSQGSATFFDDLTLIKYVLGSSGAVRNFQVLGGNIGYTWTASEAQAKDMKAYGKLDDDQIEHATKVGANWLEYQCRLITSSLRPLDLWLDPYDDKYYKGLWGEKVMDYRYKKHGIFENDENLRQHPHKVWENAVRGIFDESLATKVMCVVGKL